MVYVILHATLLTWKQNPKGAAKRANVFQSMSQAHVAMQPHNRKENTKLYRGCTMLQHASRPKNDSYHLNENYQHKQLTNLSTRHGLWVHCVMLHSLAHFTKGQPQQFPNGTFA